MCSVCEENIRIFLLKWCVLNFSIIAVGLLLYYYKQVYSGMVLMSLGVFVFISPYLYVLLYNMFILQ